jgi:hypothetical protein
VLLLLKDLFLTMAIGGVSVFLCAKIASTIV